MEKRRDRVFNRTTISTHSLAELGGKELFNGSVLGGENENGNVTDNDNDNKKDKTIKDENINTNENTITKTHEFKYLKIVNSDKLIKLNRKSAEKTPRMKTKLFTIKLIESLIQVTKVKLKIVLFFIYREMNLRLLKRFWGL